jgi:gamma-glutamyltranspeptidase / glutathione hydrolase
MKNVSSLFFFSFLLITGQLFSSPSNSCAIASPHILATEAGYKVIDEGGNAFDAAVAVTATLAVVEPSNSGLGGGGFWLLYESKTNKTIIVDGREVAPLKAHEDLYLLKDGSIDNYNKVNGGLSCAIPGEVAALVHIAEKYGVLSLKTSLAPAIKIAKEGFKPDFKLKKLLEERLEVLVKDNAFTSLFLKENSVNEIKDVIIQKDLAHTLEEIVLKGNQGFYFGKIANMLAASVNSHGGIWSLEDLMSYEIIEREPYSFKYMDMEIVTPPPPSSGGVVLHQICNILNTFPLDQLKQSDQIHILIEAMRRAYRDSGLYLGDPDYVSMEIENLTSIAYANKEHSTINLATKTPSNTLDGVSTNSKSLNTSHFSILDNEGNMVSATLTINLPYGAGFIAQGTGVILNNEMDDFSAKVNEVSPISLAGGEANSIEPGKRILSSMTPTFFYQKDKIGILGSTGGTSTITQVLLSLLDALKDNGAESWVSIPRFHHQYLPDEVLFEPGSLSSELKFELNNKGHLIQEVNSPWGHMHAILWDKKRGVIEAASDPRWKSGKAIVFEKKQ